MEGDNDNQELCEWQKPRRLPGYSGEKLPGSKAEGGEEVKEDEEEAQQVENEVMTAILTAGLIQSLQAANVAADAERSSGGDVAKELFQQVCQSWGLLAGGRRV